MKQDVDFNEESSMSGNREYSDISEELLNVQEAHENGAIYNPEAMNCEGQKIHLNTDRPPLARWVPGGSICNVCFYLQDSAPVKNQNNWYWEKRRTIELASHEARELTVEENKRLQYLYSSNIERYLNTGYGSCLLRIPQAAQIVIGSLMFFNEQRYRMHCWCVMPNHVRAVFQLLGQHTLSQTLRNWKSFTAKEINKLLGRQGTLWHADSYHRIFLSETEYHQQLQNIWYAPDRNGFQNWPWRWINVENKSNGGA